MRRFQEGKSSFNKIQSWWQQVDEIQHTQRMLLSVSSKKFSGCKLKNINKLSDKKYSKGNLIEINNQSRVFKISQTQNDWMSKTLSAFKKTPQLNLQGTGIKSQQISPKRNYSSYLSKTEQKNKLRIPLSINTKQFSLKLKRITRPQSHSEIRKSFSPTRQRINKVLDWKCEMIESKNGIQINSKDSNANDKEIRKIKIKTLPSVPDQMQQNQRPNKLKFLKPKIVERTSKEKNNSFKSIKVKQSLVKKSLHQKIDPRVKLEIQITQKLFAMQKLNKKSS